MKCELCKRKFDNKLSLGKHIARVHDYSTKKYYDDFLKIKNEGECVICGDESIFFSFVKGYSDTCCKKCASINRRKKLKNDKEKYQKFINKVKNNQKEIWENRSDDEKNKILSKARNTNKDNIKKLTKEERIEKYGYLNKLKGKERKDFISKIIKPLSEFRENASEYELREVIERVRKTKLGDRYNQDIMESYIFYRNEVRMLTERTYKKYKKIINPNGYRRSKKSNGYQLDHKYSIVEGFKNNINPEIMSSIFNLEMIKSLENNKKNYRCSITKKELFNLYYGKRKS